MLLFYQKIISAAFKVITASAPLLKRTVKSFYWQTLNFRITFVESVVMRSNKTQREKVQRRYFRKLLLKKQEAGTY